MPVIEIKSEADIEKLGFGDSYTIDTFPPPEQEDQDITPEMLDERDRLQLLVEVHLEKLSEPTPPAPLTKSQLNRMKEADVVAIANAWGIPASVDDKKSDTIEKILKAQSDS